MAQRLQNLPLKNLHRLSRVVEEIANFISLHAGPMARVQMFKMQAFQVGQSREVKIDIKVRNWNSHPAVYFGATASVDGIADKRCLVRRIVQGQVAVRMSGDMQHLQIPSIVNGDPLSSAEADIDPAPLPGFHRNLLSQANVMLFLKKVVSLAKQTARIFHQMPVRISTCQQSARHALADR